MSIWDHPAVNTTPKKAGWLAVAVTLAAAWEGLYLHPYYDIVHVKTVCYGATAVDGVDLNKTYTKAECQAMLAKDLVKYDKQIQTCIAPKTYAALPANRHAALVDLDYNIGQGAFCKSSVVRLLNAGNVTGACNAILLFDRAGGRVVQGLVNRRKAEQKLCLSTQ